MERRKFLVSGAGAGSVLAIASPTASVAQTSTTPPDRITSRMAGISHLNSPALNRQLLQDLINLGKTNAPVNSRLATVELVADGYGEIIKIDGPIEIPAQTEIVGNGRWSFNLVSTKLDAPIFKVMGANCSIRGVHLRYDGVPFLGANAIEVTGRQTFDASRLWITRCWNGIVVDGGGNHSFTDIRCYEYESSAILVSASVGITLTNFLFEAGNSIRGRLGGIRLQGGVEGFTASQGGVQRGVYGLTTADFGTNARFSAPFYNRFSNVYFDSQIKNPALLRSLHHTDFTGCWFASAGHDEAQGWTAALYEAGIDMLGCTHLRFQGGDVIGNGGMGALIYSTNKFISFSGGMTFKSNYLATTSNNLGGAAIVITPGTSDFTLTGVQFQLDDRDRVANPTWPASKQTASVSVQTGASNRYRIVNNSLGGTSQPVQDGGTGTSKVVSGNF